MKRWIALVLVVFVAVIGAGSYFAMEACSVVMTCYAGDPDPDPDAQIDACTRMIESGFMIGESVAFPLQVWGDAYVRKGLYDLAIADYDEAIRLLPEFPSFFYGRGDAYLRKDLPDRAIAGPIVELDVRTLYLRDLTLFGTTYQPGNILPDVIGYIERGELQPLIAQEFDLKDLRHAQQAFLDKTHIGKIVVRVE